MSKQKITEQELFAKIAKLQEQMDQSVEEGWWGDNMPELLGGDKAKAPMKVAVTPKNYARVQKMLPAMYTAAKVDPNADDVIKQRFGVYLPPFEKWDGTVPSGRGDFLTRNVFGRGDAAAAEAEGTKAQQAEVERQQRVEANAKKLTDLYGKLKEVLPAAFAEKAAATVPAADPATERPVKESLAESMKRLSLMITEAEVVTDAPAASQTASTAHPAEAVIQEINDTIAAIEADDPDEEDLQLIAAVKGKIEQAQTIIKQEAEAAKNQSVPAAGPASAQSEIDAQIEKDKANLQNSPATYGAAPANAAQVKDPAAQANRIADRMDAEAGANPVGVNQTNQIAANAQNMINSTWKQIYDLNKSIIGNNPNLIKPGQKFELPNGMGNYTVAPGDNLTRIAQGRGLGKYDTNVPPQTPAGQRPGGIAFNQDAPNVATTKPPFKKELSADDMKAITGVEYGPGVDLKTPFSKDLPSLKPATKLVVYNGKTVAIDASGKILAAWDGEGTWKVGPALPPELQNVTVPQFTPKAAASTNPQFSKSTPGNHIQTSSPEVTAMQNKADKDPNGVSYRTSVQEDQTLARIVSLVNHR